MGGGQVLEGGQQMCDWTLFQSPGWTRWNFFGFGDYADGLFLLHRSRDMVSWSRTVGMTPCFRTLGLVRVVLSNGTEQMGLESRKVLSSKTTGTNLWQRDVQQVGYS